MGRATGVAPGGTNGVPLIKHNLTGAAKRTISPSANFSSRTVLERTIMRNALGKTLFGMALTFVLAVGGVLVSSVASAADGAIELEIYKAGLVVGASGGSGVLKFQGKDYPVRIGGVSLGATIGASKAELIGEVNNLKDPADIEGIYTSTQAGLAVAGGNKVAQLKNSKGVELKVKGKQIGLELSLDLSGMQLSLKK
jgi:lipid-binding SYLF domain-containing protein